MPLGEARVTFVHTQVRMKHVVSPSLEMAMLVIIAVYSAGRRWGSVYEMTIVPYVSKRAWRGVALLEAGFTHARRAW